MHPASMSLSLNSRVCGVRVGHGQWQRAISLLNLIDVAGRGNEQSGVLRVLCADTCAGLLVDRMYRLALT